jgi:hypothetical protein
VRLFFDVLTPEARSYDFSGRDFPSAEDARSVAELIATDLGCSATNDYAGSRIQVSNAAGETLFAIPILAVA